MFGFSTILCLSKTKRFVYCHEIPNHSVKYYIKLLLLKNDVKVHHTMFIQTIIHLSSVTCKCIQDIHFLISMCFIWYSNLSVVLLAQCCQIRLGAGVITNHCFSEYAFYACVKKVGFG